MLHPDIGAIAGKQGDGVQVAVDGGVPGDDAGDGGFAIGKAFAEARAVLVDIDICVVTIAVCKAMVATRYICIVRVCRSVGHTIESHQLTAQIDAQVRHHR